MQLSKETIYDIKDGVALRKALVEAEVVGKKCHLYASMAQDSQAKSLFETTARDMDRAVDRLKKMAPRYM